MKQIYCVLAISLLVATKSSPAQKNAWVEFASTDSSSSYFDQTSLQPDLSRQVAYFAWWRADLSAPSLVDGKAYTSHLSNYRVDCMRRTLQQQKRYFFSAAGKQVAVDGVSGESLPEPDTLGASFVKVICARAGR